MKIRHPSNLVGCGTLPTIPWHMGYFKCMREIREEICAQHRPLRDLILKTTFWKPMILLNKTLEWLVMYIQVLRMWRLGLSPLVSSISGLCPKCRWGTFNNICILNWYNLYGWNPYLNKIFMHLFLLRDDNDWGWKER